MEQKNFFFFGDIEYYDVLMALLPILEDYMGTLEIFPRKNVGCRVANEERGGSG